MKMFPFSPISSSFFPFSGFLSASLWRRVGEKEIVTSRALISRISEECSMECIFCCFLYIVAPSGMSFRRSRWLVSQQGTIKFSRIEIHSAVLDDFRIKLVQLVNANNGELKSPANLLIAGRLPSIVTLFLYFRVSTSWTMALALRTTAIPRRKKKSGVER